MPSIISILVPVALSFAAPQAPAPGAYQEGLFCDSVELVASVVDAVDRGADPFQTVRAINERYERRACLYTARTEVLTEVVGFERKIAANDTIYGIYRVSVSGLGHQATEIGEVVWKFSRPQVMYTLRKAPADGSADR